jgi:carbon-monoxide dehydrogenase medium subunit
VAAVFEVADGKVASARIAITGATSIPTRATAAEAALTGRFATAESFRAAAEEAAYGLDINGDHYASAEYRTHLVKVLTRRVLENALA